MERNDYCSGVCAANTIHPASKAVESMTNRKSGESRKRLRPWFTGSEVATLTGICVDHLHNFAKSRHLGFIARAAEAAGKQADQWLFTLSDLMVLVTLFPKCTH